MKYFYFKVETSADKTAFQESVLKELTFIKIQQKSPQSS